MLFCFSLSLSPSLAVSRLTISPPVRSINNSLKLFSLLFLSEAQRRFECIKAALCAVTRSVFQTKAVSRCPPFPQQPPPKALGSSNATLCPATLPDYMDVQSSCSLGSLGVSRRERASEWIPWPERCCRHIASHAHTAAGTACTCWLPSSL